MKFVLRPISNNREVCVSHLPNSQASVLVIPARLQAPVGSKNAERERPADKRASHEPLSGLGGWSYSVLNDTFSRESYKAEVAEVSNKKIASAQARADLITWADEKTTIVNLTSKVRSRFMRFYDIARTEWRIINICALNIRSASVISCAHFKKLFNFVCHFLSPTPDSPRRALHHLMMNRHYHPMSDISIAKVIFM